MNKESWEVQLLNASYFQLLSFHQQYYENERCPELNDLEADEMGSAFLHLRSGVPVTRSLQIQSPLIPTVEKMAPSENVQEIEAGATSTAREGDIASSNRVRYGECRKNHAASIGGYAVDGCTEFMASGDEGTAATMICAACNCHRSFHRREVENETLCEYHRIRR